VVILVVAQPRQLGDLRRTQSPKRCPIDGYGETVKGLALLGDGAP
jgi:hypothetical protein